MKLHHLLSVKKKWNTASKNDLYKEKITEASDSDYIFGLQTVVVTPNIELLLIQF